MKKTFFYGVCAVLVMLFSMNIFAASNAVVFPNSFESRSIINNTKVCPTVPSDIVPTFCGVFKNSVESCSGIHNMVVVYSLMMKAYGNSLTKACAANAQTSGGTVEGCIGQWTCYWHGGSSLDMGGPCDGDGKACASYP